MDLTTAWCRIESLVESLAPFIDATEKGTKGDYVCAVKEIKRRTSEIVQLTQLAEQLSQDVSERMQPPTDNGRKAAHNPLLTVKSRPDMMVSKRRKLDSEPALIDLTAEDVDDEDNQEPPEKSQKDAAKP